MSQSNNIPPRFIPTVPLKNINIGQVSGESEAKSPYFEDLFYTGNRKYEELCKPEKFIIRGRKGTGKTILAHYMKKKADENNICSCHINTLKDIHLKKLIHLDDRDILDEEYKIFWRYCVLLELGDAILKKHDWFVKFTNKDIRKLNKFVTERYANRFKLVELSKSYNTSKKQNASLNIDLSKSKNPVSKLIPNSSGVSKEKSSGITETYQVKEYYNDVEPLEELILKILSKENKGYMIIYDDLDELGDNLEEHKNYRKLILGMIFAIQGLNNKIQDVNDYSKIIIAIRSDILKSLNKHSSNLRKVISDNSVNLYWINKDCSHHTDYLLIDLILTKIKASTPEYRNIPNKILFKALFPKDVSRKKTSDYLLELSMGRPRQVIEFLNIFMSNYPNETSFKTHQFFRNCLKSYSPEIYNDLENEFSVYENKDELNDSIKLIKDLKKSEFRFGEIAGQYNAHKNKYKHINSIENSLNYMYNFGVIGTYENSDNNPRYSWGYRDDGNDSIDPEQIFLVHFALKHKFNIS